MEVAIDKAITVGSSNVEIGEALAERARAYLSELASKYFGRITTGSVHFGREGVEYRCSVNMRCGAVPMMSAEASNKDAHVALTMAVDKLGNQLRRAKRGLRDEKIGRGPKGAPEVSR
jgi:ribosomal subunit interface protein